MDTANSFFLIVMPYVLIEVRSPQVNFDGVKWPSACDVVLPPFMRKLLGAVIRRLAALASEIGGHDGVVDYAESNELSYRGIAVVEDVMVHAKVIHLSFELRLLFDAL